MPRYDLRVNGSAQSVESPDADKPLLYVLRDLGLTATKFGCGLGQCGACTVLADGAAVQSCQMSCRRCAGQADHHAGRTRVGVKTASTADRLYQQQVPQCGYCTSGMIMSAAALLSDKQKAERGRHPLGARR